LIRRKISLILLITFINHSYFICSKSISDRIVKLILKHIVKKDTMTLPIESNRNENTEILKRNKNIEYSVIGQSNCGRNIELFKIGNKGKKNIIGRMFSWIRMDDISCLS